MKQQITISKQGAALVVAFLLIFGSGYQLGQRKAVSTGVSAGVQNQDKGKPEKVDFGLFWDAWKVVNDKYVKAPDDQERVYGAIAGMVAGLGDPFSVFMKPSDSTRFSEDISGNFEGIGAELVQKEGYITVVAPLDDSPAQKAGLLAGDIILKIDKTDVPASLEDAVAKIRGKKGTTVTLTVAREGKQRDISITRDQVEVKSVSYSLHNTTAVIKINQFNANTTSLLDEALAKMKQDNATSLVVDLRNNPGGLLNVAVDITSRFIEPGVVVIERDRDKKEEALSTTPVSSRISLPMVILANKGSASASEIFSGALQDAGRAKVVGETTFGKGSVQSVEQLKDGSAIRITIAEWLTPKKREINKQGIKPDVEVKMTEEDVAAKRDPQLDKAFELLK
ncbi:MAG TPA: S41 family peptidase [Patescibacteria group bacterium]